MKKIIALMLCLAFSSVAYADTCMPEKGVYQMKARKRWGTCENFEGIIVLEASNNKNLVHCKGGFKPLENECGISVDLVCTDHDPQTKKPLGRVAQVGKIVRKDSKNLHGVIEFTSRTMRGELICQSLYDIEYREL